MNNNFLNSIVRFQSSKTKITKVIFTIIAACCFISNSTNSQYKDSLITPVNKSLLHIISQQEHLNNDIITINNNGVLTDTAAKNLINEMEVLKAMYNSDKYIIRSFYFQYDFINNNCAVIDNNFIILKNNLSVMAKNIQNRVIQNSILKLIFSLGGM